jgi:hypothetical protein
MEERDGGGGMLSAALVNMAKVVLMLLNMAFMVLGCLLVYFGHRVKESGWLDVFEGDYEWIGSWTFIFLLALGAVVIALAALGCMGAWLQQRVLLAIYAVVLVLTAAPFVVLIIGGSSAHSTAEEWSAEDYPASDNEESLAASFNTIYCLAQVPYYCEDMAVNDVLSMFNMTLDGYFSDSTTNFTSLCGSVDVDQVNTICTVCEYASEYETYDVVLSWTDSECARNSANEVYCGALLLNATSGNDTSATGAPFLECRTSFYELVEKWTSALMVGSIVVVLVVVVLFAFTMLLWCSAKRGYGVGGFHKSPPPTPLYQYGNPVVASGATPAGVRESSEVYAQTHTSTNSYGQPMAHQQQVRRYNSPY